MNVVKFGKNMKKLEKDIKKVLSERQFKLFKGDNDYVDSQIKEGLNAEQATYLMYNWDKINETVNKIPRYKDGSKEMQDAYKKIMRLVNERIAYIANHPIFRFKCGDFETNELCLAVFASNENNLPIEAINDDTKVTFATWSHDEAKTILDTNGLNDLVFYHEVKKK